MVGDDVPSKPRPKRLASSQRAMLEVERDEAWKNLAVGKYLGRILFVGLFVTIGLHGADERRFLIAMSMASGTLAFFWALDEFRQRNRLRRINKLFEYFEEKMSPRYSQDTVIQVDYYFRNSFQELYIGQLQRLEPFGWLVAILTTIWQRF